MWCSLRCGLPVTSVGGGFIKGTIASASSSVWEKAAHSALTLIWDNSVSPYLSLVPFKLMPQCWSSESMIPISPCVGSLGGNFRDSRSPPSHSGTTPTSFYSQKSWELLLLALEPWGGGPGVGLGPLALWGTLHLRCLSQLLSITCGCWTTLFCASASPTSLWSSFFFNSLVVGLLFSQILGSSEWWWFCSLATILMQLWEEVSTA